MTTTIAAASSIAWSSLRRPLHLPSVGAGGACPTSQGHIVSPAFGPALGAGPVYPVGFGTKAVLPFDPGARLEGGWYYVKVLWVAAPGQRGPFLVRGGRIDMPGELRFQDGPNPDLELHLTVPTDTTDPHTPETVVVAPGAKGWASWPTYTRVRRPEGCYAYQVDGSGFSLTIVFRA